MERVADMSKALEQKIVVLRAILLPEAYFQLRQQSTELIFVPFICKIVHRYDSIF